MRNVSGELLVASRSGHWSSHLDSPVARRPLRVVAVNRLAPEPRRSPVGRARLAVADALVSVAFVVAGSARGSPSDR